MTTVSILMHSSSHSPYLETLNDSQRQAVEATEGPVLVLAGAGTGKTKVLITRLTHILASGLAYPSQILAVTFTNKAAHEMKERIMALTGRASEGIWLGTFHALAVRILRNHAELVGLKANFTILDADDQQRLIKQILESDLLDDRKNPPRLVLSIISRWKDRGLLPDRVSQEEARHQSLILSVYRRYQERLLTLNAVDFGDLLLHCLTLFTKHPDVLAKYQHQFHYILVDEYQDTNVAQYLWLRLLSQDRKNICCVGDDDQSIYGWRGAEIGNILKFEKDFPGAKIIRLEQNYRSTRHILGAASGLIAKNEGRLGKSLWTERDGGEKVIVRGSWDSEEEARTIGEDIEALHRKGLFLSSIAILVRAGFQTREFEERFLMLGIPYRVIGGPRFYERMEIRDALAYLRLVCQSDDGLAFERIINTPRRGIGNTTIQMIHTFARNAGISLPQAARELCDTDELKGAARTAIRAFFANLDRWRNLLPHHPHVELAKIILDESGYTTMWMNDKSADAPGRLENLKELVGALEEFDSLPGFLEHVSLVMDNAGKTQGDMVTIMTLHSAKGLEFDTVFLSGWEEGLFPHPRTLEESGNKGLEEERRLAYVGITRAQRQVTVTFSLNRRMHQGRQFSLPSRFISELPEEHVITINLNRDMANPQYPREKTISHDSYAKNSNFSRGDRVFHQKFGYGRVIDIAGDRLEVDFDHSDVKKIIASFVQKA